MLTAGRASPFMVIITESTATMTVISPTDLERASNNKNTTFNTTFSLLILQKCAMLHLRKEQGNEII